MQLFYSNSITPNENEFHFDKQESKHIVKVLRKSLGDSISITDGLGRLYKGQIINDSPTLCTVAIREIALTAPLAYHLHIAIAPTKSNDRFEWFLEKATEIGISEITPIICDHSERKTYKTPRGNKIIQSAMKQSLKTHLPILNDQIPFLELLNKAQHYQPYIAHCQNAEKIKIHQIKADLKPNSKILILIGPEGDFSKKELNLALEHGFKALSLGENRLRTETAALLSCMGIWMNFESNK